MGNALRLTTKGTVDVRTKRSGAAADDRTATFRFEVDDTGIGMAPEQLARIFDAITQADGSITLRYAETSLGLSIEQRLAQLMGGSNKARNMPGVGSSFSVKLALSAVASVARP
jgi:signal transduction histidine kinase